MKKILRSLVYTEKEGKEFINPLMHLFFFITFVFGFFFVFFTGAESTNAIVLYQVSVAYFSGTAISFWGYLAMGITVLNTFCLIVRGRVGLALLPIVSLGGIYLWLYASVIYALEGFILQLLAAGIPNLLFWVYYGWKIIGFRADYNLYVKNKRR
jgi:hypothetical protein